MKTLSSLAVYFGIAFPLHLVWEVLQGPLFAGFESYAGHFLPCLWGAATGDMIFMGVIYLSLAASFGQINWLSRPFLLREPSTWMLAPLIGALLGAGFELWAVHVDRRWAYGQLMPIVPVLQVGWTPVAQMLVVPLTTIGLSSWLLRRIGIAPSSAP